jgi:hypothetical protein
LTHPTTMAAIQHGYETARACIIDPARPSWYSAEDSDAYPDTEEIGVHAVKPSLVTHALPGTEGMSVAARLLAEQMTWGGLQAPTRGFRSRPARVPPARGRWWRGMGSRVTGVSRRTSGASPRTAR